MSSKTKLVAPDKKSEGTTLTKLRQLRKINDITLDRVAMDTGLSVGYLNRIERGYITDIKNIQKRKRLENYIRKLEIKTKKELNLV